MNVINTLLLKLVFLIARDATGGWAYGSVTGDASSGQILSMTAGNDYNNNNSMLGVGGYGVNFDYGVPNMSVVGTATTGTNAITPNNTTISRYGILSGYYGVTQRTYSTMGQSLAPHSTMPNQSWHAPQPPQQQFLPQI